MIVAKKQKTRDGLVLYAFINACALCILLFFLFMVFNIADVSDKSGPVCYM